MVNQLTQQGYVKIQQEYKELVEKKRPYVIDRLQKARGMGDLSENSEYTASKDELAFVEGRILEIEAILKNAKIVASHNHNPVVDVGSKVVVQVDGNTDEFEIVGEFEADPLNKKLSSTSPIGQALLGKKVQDEVEVEIPAGKTKYKIVAIK
jgi:transcription elongation factor GreA